MKIRVAVVVMVVLMSFAFVVPASAAVRESVTAKSPARHRYSWAKLAPVDQVELAESRSGKPGSVKLVPAGPELPARTARGGARLRAVRLDKCWDGFACPPFGKYGAGLILVKTLPPHPIADGAQA